MEDKPTELTMEDIDNFVSKLIESQINTRTCFKCGCEFFPNYHGYKCDGCFFSQFPKEQVKEFCRSFFE